MSLTDLKPRPGLQIRVCENLAAALSTTMASLE
jgi:hypothetical protein